MGQIRRYIQNEKGEWAPEPARGPSAPAAKAQPPRRAGIGERLALAALAVLALAMALPGWVRGARYTVEGWRVVVEVIAGILGVTARVSLPSGPAMAGLVLGVGALYSLAEVKARPRMSWLRWGLGVMALAVAVWIVVLGTDIGTTIIGVLNTPRTAWAPERWMAARPWAASLYGAFLTFYPEGLTLLAGQLLRRAVS